MMKRATQPSVVTPQAVIHVLKEAAPEIQKEIDAAKDDWANDVFYYDSTKANDRAALLRYKCVLHGLCELNSSNIWRKSTLKAALRAWEKDHESCITRHRKVGALDDAATTLHIHL